MMGPRLAEAHERLRVALIDPGDFTPAYDLALANGLIESGHSVQLIGKHGFREARRPAFRLEHFYRGLDRPMVRRLPAPLFRSIKGIRHGLDLASLARTLKNWRPDIVHFQWLPLPLMDRLFLPRLQRFVPLVITLHDSNPYNGAVGRLMRLGYLAMIQKADAVIVHTAQAEARLAELGLPSSRVHRLPHGLLHTNESVSPEPPSPRSDSRLRLLQFGKIRAYKGVDVLLTALAKLEPQDRARLHVRIVGRPYIDTGPLREFVHEHGLETTVEFRFDFVDEGEISGMFANSDAALFPYREIDASGVAMTAVAHGIPVLASAIGGFHEQFRDGREARLVPPGDAACLANVLREWARAPEVLKQLAGGMRIYRSHMPDWIEIGRRTAAIYAAVRHAWVGRRAQNKGTNEQLLPEGTCS